MLSNNNNFVKSGSIFLASFSLLWAVTYGGISSMPVGQNSINPNNFYSQQTHVLTPQPSNDVHRKTIGHQYHHQEEEQHHHQEEEEHHNELLHDGLKEYFLTHVDHTHLALAGAVLVKLAFFAVIIYSLLFPTIITVEAAAGSETAEVSENTVIKAHKEKIKKKRSDNFLRRHGRIRNGHIELNQYRNHHRQARQVIDSDECMRRIICELTSRSSNTTFSSWISEDASSDCSTKFPCNVKDILRQKITDMAKTWNNFI